MRIGIDVQSVTGNPSGIGYYTSNLVSNLRRIDLANEYVLLASRFFQGNLATPKRIFWEQVALPMEIYKKKIDLLHTPGFSPPLARNCKVVVTVHDLIGIRIPENNLSLASRFYWSKYLPKMARNADIIITDSEYSRRDIVELLKVSEEKVKVIYLAAGDEFHPIEDEEKVRNVRVKYGIGRDRYALYVGNIEFRKNLVFLLDIWKKFQFRCKLVIVGAETKFAKNLSLAIVEKKLSDEVIITGYVPGDDLVSLYNGATLFVCLSLYEGFGLPVLEAMSCGTPVVVSNVSSLPEIVGEAGVKVSPADVEKAGSAIGRVLNDKKLRQELKEKGLLRAKAFSWKKVAEETLQVYRSL